MYVLGGVTLTYNPTRNSGIPTLKSRVDCQTLAGNITQVWGFFDEDSFIDYEWDLLPATDYDALMALHIAGDGLNTYTLDPEDGHTYDVEIADLDGVLYLGNDWRRNVRMTLKLFERLT